MRIPCAVPALLSLLVLAGCQPRDPARAMLEDYAYRIANVLGADIAEPDSVNILQTLPPRRDRHMETGDLRIGLLDYLDLKACDLRHLVSQRNSVLGRVMPPSRRLVYESQLLNALDACHDHLQEHPPKDPEFADLIAEARAQKRMELPNIAWNASFAVEEIEMALGLTRGPLQPGTEQLLRASASEFQWFAETIGGVLQKRQTPDIEALESRYQALAFNPAPGQLFQALVLAIEWLSHVSQLLENTNLQRLCPQEVPTRKARILQTVFAKFYAGAVQPWLSMLHREGGGWLLAANQLIDAQQLELPASFQSYAQIMLSSDHPDSLWTRFDAAIQGHTESWQRVLGHCGMMPSVQTLQDSAARSLP